MGQKNNFLRKKEECTQTLKRMKRLNMRSYSDEIIDNNLLEVKNDHERTSALFCLNSENILMGYGFL